MERVEEVQCPVCSRVWPLNLVNDHVEKCLFLHSGDNSSSRDSQRQGETHGHDDNEISTGTGTRAIGKSDSLAVHRANKRPKLIDISVCTSTPSPDQLNTLSKVQSSREECIPLAEKMRPSVLEEYVGQHHVMGNDKMLNQLLLSKDIPSMILWGPPGCGKTSLANVISNICKNDKSLRFMKLTATMSGINDVKEVVKVATNEYKFKRRTILFMDEIHRFNKLQQDAFLPHIENGTFVLIGATTENPSFSLNSALLSRCRVIVLEKLSVNQVMSILVKAARYKNVTIVEDVTEESNASTIICNKTLCWLAEICDGDARIALNSFQLAIQCKNPATNVISMEMVKDAIKRSHILYDKKGEEHYNTISALHKAVRASDDNAAIYWLTRMLVGGEDPLYIARRLVRIAGEDIGLADPNALNISVACMQGCQLIGMPECDVLLAECVTYLSRAPKSTEVYKALLTCKSGIQQHKGPLPSVPLHLRNAPTKLTSQLGYGKGYNTKQKDESGLSYMPQGMEDVVYFFNKT